MVPLLLAGLSVWLVFGAARAAAAAFIGTFVPNPPPIASTVPPNGDVNPYGLVTVPTTIGSLRQGNLLISNFNNSNNLQGTGTTIVQITPNGKMSLFAQIDANRLPGECPGGIGLTTALVALKSGWVIVGSAPSADGTTATRGAGCLIVLDSMGKAVETFYGSLINGPWDMTAFEEGQDARLFVTNVLYGTVAAALASGGRLIVLAIGEPFGDHRLRD